MVHILLWRTIRSLWAAASPLSSSSYRKIQDFHHKVIKRQRSQTYGTHPETVPGWLENKEWPYRLQRLETQAPDTTGPEKATNETVHK